MRALAPQLSLVEQAYEAILSAISDGRLQPNARLIQDELAETLFPYTTLFRSQSHNAEQAERRHPAHG